MKKLIFAALIALSFSACQTKIDLDLPDNDPKLVVEGVIGDTIEPSLSYVKLTTTSPYFENKEAPTVSDAKVELLENDVVVEVVAESGTEKGRYPFTYKGVPGKSYSLRINALGEDYYTLKEELIPCPDIILFGVEYVDQETVEENPLQFDTAGFFMGVATSDDGSIPNWYRFQFDTNDVSITDPFNIAITPDLGFNGFDFIPFDPYGEAIDSAINIHYIQSTLTNGYYDFLFSLRQQTAFVGGPFDTPPAPINGNIRKSVDDAQGLGYFAASGIRTAEASTPDRK